MLRRLSEAETAEARKSLFRLLRVYALAGIIPAAALVIFTIWAAGYALGYLDGWNGRPQIMESSNERNH